MLFHHLPRLVPGASRVAVLTSAVLLGLTGCGGGGGYTAVTDQDVEQAEAHIDDHHHHAHTAPHGGHLIELGDHQYVAEVVLEEAEGGRLVVYFLDAHAENAVAIPLEKIEFAVEGGEPITLAAEPQDGDAAGSSSRFSASGDSVTVTDIEELHGGLTVEIQGTTYTGALSHSHDHDHAH
ncbi:MAG: hypothetical protein KF861_20205 [Planctomycetaceae bacterium]|nr:hypothetical protein [Planctomycetaceae bacterium]